MGLKSNLADWGNLTGKADVIFTQELRKLKKSNPPAAASLSTMVVPVQKGTDLIVHSLDRLLTLAGGSDTIGTSNCPPETLKAMNIEFQKLGAEVKKYVALVDKAIGAKVHVTPTQTKSIKDAYPEPYRHLKLLKTGVGAIEATTATMLKGIAVAKDLQKIDEKSTKKIGKAQAAMDNDKVKALKNDVNQRKDLLTLAVRYRSAMAKGAAAIQRVKNSPDVTTYNGEFYKAGRDISQIIGNIKKMKSTDKIKDLSEVKRLPDPGSLAAEIAKFGDDRGEYRSLADTATHQDVVQALKLYSTVLKQIAVLYKPLADMK